MKFHYIYCKCKILILLFTLVFLNPLFSQNSGCEYSQIFSHIPGTQLVEGENLKYELRLPTNKWTPTGGVISSSGRGNGSFSFLSFNAYIKKFNRDGVKTGRVYQVDFTNTSKFTITFGLNWEGKTSGGYTLKPGEKKTSFDHSSYYKDGSNYPKFTISGVQIKFTHTQYETYGVYYSKYFDCFDTPEKVAKKILEDLEMEKLEDEKIKISNLPENSIENIDSKINQYKRLAQKHEGKTFQNEINQLEQKKKGEIYKSKAKEISQLPENTIEDIDQKIQQYQKLASVDNNNSYQDQISSLQEKKDQLNIQSVTPTDKISKNYPIEKSDFNESNTNGNSVVNTNTNITKTKSPINKTSINNEKAKKYYDSAFKNAESGNFNQGIKDLKLQKAYTSDPKERAKIESNIETLKSRQNYQNKWTQVNQKIERYNYLNQQSLDFTNKVDAASNGDHLMAASQKFGYALGSAIAGRLDVNSIAGTAVSVISYIGQKKKEKEALEAQKRAIKQKIAEENRKRELERQKYLNGLKRERRLVIKDLPKYFYPNYLTGEDISTYYYFVIYTNQDILNTDYPEAGITDIIDVKKYKDGTWPFENDFKASLQNLSSKPIKHIIGYTNYEIAAGKLGEIIKGFGRGGVKLSFIKASKNNIIETDDISSLSSENKKDFWGKTISNETKVNKAPSKQKKLEEGADFWGKSVKLKNKVNPVKKAATSKKKDFWGKTIKIKN